MLDVRERLAGADEGRLREAVDVGRDVALRAM